MSADGQAGTLLREARSLISSAAEAWKRGETADLEATPGKLEEAIRRIRAAAEDLADSAGPGNGVAVDARVLRAEFERLVKLVDSRASFFRRLGAAYGAGAGMES